MNIIPIHRGMIHKHKGLIHKSYHAHRPLHHHSMKHSGHGTAPKKQSGIAGGSEFAGTGAKHHRSSKHALKYRF